MTVLYAGVAKVSSFMVKGIASMLMLLTPSGLTWFVGDFSYLDGFTP